MATIAEPLWRLAYPEQCAVCGEVLRGTGRHLCDSCHERLSWIGPHACPRCGERVGAHSVTDGGCAACRGRRFAFVRAVAPFAYDGAIRELLLRFKLGRQASLSYLLGDLLCSYLEQGTVTPLVDLVVPVPLHWTRRVLRGFNQAGLLALAVGQRFGLPVAVHALRRKRRTQTQTAMSGGGRRANVRGAFVAAGHADDRSAVSRVLARVRRTPNLEGQRVLLVDDIITTGSTVHECARALKAGGAQKVYVAAVAR